jgi:N-acetylmuramoyl-L-alanine amidase CwlA
MDVIKNLVAEDKYCIKCPNAMTPEFIVVHNTANDASARNEVSYMIRNDNQVSYHYAIDDKEIVQGIPEDRNAWHAGDGANGVGNRKGIAVEICYSKSGGKKFDDAEILATKFIAFKLKEKGWGIEKVKKHQDFSGKYCPHRTLDIGWTRFLNMIQAELNELNKDNGIAIMGKSFKSAAALQAELQSKNPTLNPRFKDIANTYLKIGAKYNVKGDIAFCQMAHETGWLKFGGQVSESQNNFAGIGATNGGAKGAVFASIEDGVTAHIQHLYAYASSLDLPKGEYLIDPRFNLVKRGIAPYWTDLNGRWAVPGTTYGQSILKIYNAVTDIKSDYPKWRAFGNKWYYYTSADDYAKASAGQLRWINDNGKRYLVDESGAMLANVAINKSGEVNGC